MDGLSSDDDEVQFTGTLDADAARERDRAAAEASGNAFDLCSQESTPAQGQGRQSVASPPHSEEVDQTLSTT